MKDEVAILGRVGGESPPPPGSLTNVINLVDYIGTLFPSEMVALVLAEQS